jgi:hypothetical protein
VLTRRELGRATLARQLLLERSPLGPAEAVAQVAGLQAQEPQEPYVGLAARLAEPDPEGASRLLEDRVLVRCWLMRRTVHLVTATDALAWHRLHEPMLLQRAWGVLRARLPGVDVEDLRAAAEPLLDAGPRTLPDVARAVAGRWPDVAARDLADLLGSVAPVVQVPPRGLWRRPGPAACTTYRAWLGQDPEPVTDDALDDLVLRYLAAFGPAASADLRAWCGLAGLPAAVTRVRPSLVTYRDERGRELLDLPDAPLPDGTAPAPPRFLPAFDNTVLGYQDRSRVVDDEHKHLSVLGTRYLLVDGRVAGSWTTAQDHDGATVLTVTPLAGPVRSDEAEAEAQRVLDLLAPAGAGRVVWAGGAAVS